MGEFDKALSNYIKDFANGGAIRHFVELGYNVVEIKSSLDFPMSIEDVSSVVWEEYIYQDKEGFMRMLDKLKDSYRDSIKYLPWPLTKVYVDEASPIGEAVKSFYALK